MKPYGSYLFVYLIVSLLTQITQHFIAPGQLLATVSGIRDGSDSEIQTISAGIPVEIAVFGVHLTPELFEESFLTDADRCDDAVTMQKDVVKLTPDYTYKDEYTVILKSAQSLTKENGVYRICTKFEPHSERASSTLLIKVAEKQHYFLPLPALIGMYVATLILSGMFSGLNLAYTCISIDHLSMISNSGDDNASDARNILPLRRRGNWLIATFAIGNVIINILSTLLMDQILSILPESQRIILNNTIPVFLTMVFGEIFPQAICFKRALTIASKFRYVVMFFMGLLSILAWPMSLVLDLILGKEPVRVYSLGKLRALLEIHTQNELLSKVLTFSTVTVGKIMTRIQDAYLMSKNDVLDMNRMVSILEKGYTRVPVYDGLDRRKVVAVLNVKDLILVDPDDKKRVYEVIEESQGFKQTMEIRFVSQEMRAQDVMNEMIKGRQHLMMVFRFDNKMYYTVGLVTLEDIIEEFIGEIKDDDDAAFPMIRAGVRRDQSTYDWFRSEGERRTNLTANELLKMMEQILDQCESLARLNFTVYGLRALISVSKIERVEKEVILKKGSSLNRVIVVVDGMATEGGLRIAFSRPVFGTSLLDEMYHRICLKGDQAKLDDVSMVIPDNVSLIGGKGTIMSFALPDIFRILVILCRESQNEDVITQFDFYMHIMSVMAEVACKDVSMHASMEQVTQKINDSMLRELTAQSVIKSKSSLEKLTGKPSKSQKPSPSGSSKKKKQPEFFLDPKKEQKTQEEEEVAEKKTSAETVTKKPSQKDNEKSKKKKDKTPEDSQFDDKTQVSSS